MDEAIEAANEIAPEHMEIVTANPFEDMMKVKNAGAIFIGEYSSEPLGDYFAGPNHVLPTNGTAKFFSALSVDDFIKKSSIVYYSKAALRDIHKDIIQFATSEQLTARIFHHSASPVPSFLHPTGSSSGRYTSRIYSILPEKGLIFTMAVSRSLCFSIYNSSPPIKSLLFL